MRGAAPAGGADDQRRRGIPAEAAEDVRVTEDWLALHPDAASSSTARRRATRCGRSPTARSRSRTRTTTTAPRRCARKGAAQHADSVIHSSPGAPRSVDSSDASMSARPMPLPRPPSVTYRSFISISHAPRGEVPVKARVASSSPSHAPSSIVGRMDEAPEERPVALVAGLGAVEALVVGDSGRTVSYSSSLIGWTSGASVPSRAWTS